MYYFYKSYIKLEYLCLKKNGIHIDACEGRSQQPTAVLLQNRCLVPKYSSTRNHRPLRAL